MYFLVGAVDMSCVLCCCIAIDCTLLSHESCIHDDTSAGTEYSADGKDGAVEFQQLY
jgi:hypothetical protein